jgi:hypothetical protein
MDAVPASSEIRQIVQRYVADAGGSNTQLPQSEEGYPWKNAECTHTLFAGGKLAVLPKDAQKHLHEYAIDLTVNDRDDRRSELVNMVERYNPEAFPLFIDFDIVRVTPVRDVNQLHREYVRIAQREVERFYPRVEATDDLFLTVVCERAPTHECSATKYGIHVHMPHLIVDAPAALHMRESIICALRRAYDERVTEGENPWGDVVDGSVYKNSGLRAIGSYKLKKCKAGTTGHIAAGRTCPQRGVDGRPVTYWPTLALHGDGNVHGALQQQIDETFRPEGGGRVPQCRVTLDQLRTLALSGDPALERYLQAMFLFTRLTSVRVTAARTEGFAPYEGAPGPGTYRYERATGFSRELTKVPRAQYVPLKGSESEIGRHVENYLRSVCYHDGIPVWPRIEVSSVRVKRSRGEPQLLAVVRGEGSRFCLNLAARKGRRRGRDHQSNHIFFWITVTPPYVVQRCHDKDDSVDGRYRSPAMPAMRCCEFDSATANAVFVPPPPNTLRELINAQRNDNPGVMFNGMGKKFAKRARRV